VPSFAKNSCLVQVWRRWRTLAAAPPRHHHGLHRWGHAPLLRRQLTRQFGRPRHRARCRRVFAVCRVIGQCSLPLDTAVGRCARRCLRAGPCKRRFGLALVLVYAA